MSASSPTTVLPLTQEEIIDRFKWAAARMSREQITAALPPRPALRLPHPEPRYFECFFNFLGWHQWSLGFHFDPQHPHLDLHVPGGFLRIGWHCDAVSYRRMEPEHRPRHVRIW